MVTHPNPHATLTLTTADPLPPEGAGAERELELLARIAVLESDVHARDATIADLRSQVKNWAEAYSGDLETITTLRADLADANENIVAKHNAANKVIAGLHAELAKRDATIAAQEKSLFEGVSTIAALRASLARAEAIEAAGSAEPGVIEWAKDVIFRHDRPQSYDRLDMSEAIHGLRCAIARYESLPAPAADRGEQAEATENSRLMATMISKPSSFSPDGTGTPSGNHTHGEFVAWADGRRTSERERRLVEAARAAHDLMVRRGYNMLELQDALAAYPTPGPDATEAQP